ncbi:MAG: hypothetical protein COA37_15360 [Hoeflea sp.]|uniref:hypothetical protein n=1 Tax=Hoeflea sp. TaxID=1940281 RepID=UPI000C0FD553|nr:hypothetical protein [Hoeflea sp.]PHR20409.1 MAG: hypothetical protein COA37_15360 [Hoeflea sp.]
MSAVRKPAASAPAPINVVEFAQLLVNTRRAAIDLPVNQIRELAAAVLIIDQQLDDANRRIATMMLSEPIEQPERARKKEMVRVAETVLVGEDMALNEALELLLKARWQLEQERHSAGENLARQKFERTAIAVCAHLSPKQRT